MDDKKFIAQFFNEKIDNDDLEFNKLYFSELLKSFRKSASPSLVMASSNTADASTCIPLALIAEDKRKFVTSYSELETGCDQLREYTFTACKMHAGLGTSVVRAEHLWKKANRKELGSKGTDLFVNVEGQDLSLAILQLQQLKILEKTKKLKRVKLLNLVNPETEKIINEIYNDSSEYSSLVTQLKVPTIKSGGLLTDERLAPAGHGYLGFNLLLNIFHSPLEKEIISIGNGEDLNSTANLKMISWMVSKNIPIAMVTTNKKECDKKGGQIAVCHEKDQSYYTIVEKAQAEQAGQLEYFQELGLRENDHTSLFNTNIVILNVEAIKSIFQNTKGLTKEDMLNALTPTLIENTKKQGGDDYIQLEGAIGSVLLNLDKFFRLNYSRPLVHFLNLDEKQREEFFIPIKKMEDFESLLNNYRYDKETGRFQLKE